MPKTRDDFMFGSGLADNFQGTIVEAAFVVNKEYAEISGTQDPMLTLTLDGPELSQPFSQGWSCGAAKKWEATNGGKEVVSGVDPDAHGFNENSRAGQLVARMFKLVGNGDIEKGRDFFIARDKWMTQADFYDGLTFFWSRESMKTVAGDSKDGLMPTSYVATEAKKGAAKASKASPTPAATGDFSDELMERLAVFADSKTVKELKVAVVNGELVGKDDDQYKAFSTAVLKGTLIDKLKADNTLMVGPEDKFVKI